MSEIWYVNEGEGFDLVAHVFETKIEAEKYARAQFPDESEDERYARIYCKPVVSFKSDTKIKVYELQNRALDWVVTTIEKPEACKYGWQDWFDQRLHTVVNGEYVYRWHQSWAQSGPIIERERIRLDPRGVWVAGHDSSNDEYLGPTPLIAAMRCYVASKLGDEVEMPPDFRHF